jgi:hypothetical protein
MIVGILELLELSIYIIYIYSVIFFIIFIEPKLYILLIFFVYCFITTWKVFPCKKCTNILVCNKMYKFIIVTLYSLSCLFIYYIIHTTWILYKNNLLYKFVLFLIPLFYFMGSKISERVFKCMPFTVILTPLRMLLDLINFNFRNPFSL